MEPDSKWKTAAIVIGSVAALITATAALLPELRSFWNDPDKEQPAAERDPVSEAESATDEPQTETTSSPPETTPSAVESLTDKEATRLGERRMSEIIAAIQQGDLDSLAALSEPPFFAEQGSLLISKGQIRQAFGELLNEVSADEEAFPNPDQITAMLIGDAQAQGIVRGNDRLLGRLNLGADDVVVVVMHEGEGGAFYFRRSGNDLSLAGFWG